MDVTTQSVLSSTLCLVFEKVQPHDTNYSLMYSRGFLCLIYPTQMLCIYQDNEYFETRDEDEGLCGANGLENFDRGLLGGGSGAGARCLALKHVV